MTKKQIEEAIEGLYSAASELNGASVDDSYSGRGMYGKTCYGIVSRGDSEEEIIEACARNGLRGARVDSMGKGVIVYYPHIESEVKE
jgi:hypothetical protein